MQQIKYGADALLKFPLINAGAVDFEAGVTIAAGDAKVFTDELILTNISAESVAFTSGSERPSNGDTINGATSSQSGTFMFAVVTSGTWGGGDAAGVLVMKSLSGVFQSENLDINGGTANVMTIGGDLTAGLFGEIGSGGYFVALTAAETTCKNGYTAIIDSATKEWEDQHVQFETYGNASAQHAFDLNTATQSVNVSQFGGSAGTFSGGRPEVNTSHWAGTLALLSVGTSLPKMDVGSISDDATAANNAELAFDGTGYGFTNCTMPTVTTNTDMRGTENALLASTFSTMFSGITALAEWLGLMAGKQAADSTALTELKATGAGSGTYDPGTDSIEAIRDTVSGRLPTALVDGRMDSTFAELRTTIATLASQTSFTLTAGSPTDDAYNGWEIVIRDASTANERAVGLVDDYVGSSLTVTLKEDPLSGWTIATGDIVTLYPSRGLMGTVRNRTVAVDASGRLDLGAISGRAASADSLEEAMKGVVNSTAKAGTLSTTQMSTNLTEATDDHYKGRIVTWTSGVLNGQSSDITAYVGTNGVLTYTTVTDAPSAADSFVIT